MRSRSKPIFCPECGASLVYTHGPSYIYPTKISVYLECPNKSFINREDGHYWEQVEYKDRTYNYNPMTGEKLGN